MIAQIRPADLADWLQQHAGARPVVLDVREPWQYMRQVFDAMADDGRFGALLPTTNQVSNLLAAMPEAHLDCVEVMEVLIREYKALPGRLRPDDQMVGHTGFLVFACKVNYSPTATQRNGDLPDS